MTLEVAMTLAAIVMAFLVFAITLAWADWRTRDPIDN
jgi:hypothetical protein